MGYWRWIATISFLVGAGSLLAKEIVVGVVPVPQRHMAFTFTPIVLPDLISAKAAFEYRLHRKFNLVIPLEGKWMDYRGLIRFGSRVFDGPRDAPERWYQKNSLLKYWNIDFLQWKLSSGVGVKYFPISESMANAFFLKTLFMVGVEQFYAYSAEGLRDSAVFTHVFTIGYQWMKKNRFTIGFEIGEEYTLHTHPIEWIPILIDGFMPLIHVSLGFTI